MTTHAKWCAAIVLVAMAGAARAEEGKWTPQQVLQLDPQWLRDQGLELPVSRLWDPQRGTGLLAATVNIGGCSAGFVSAAGLILTNHHCLFGVLQEHSRPDRDLITNGFIAHTREEELRSKTTRVTVPRKFTDVTADIEASVPAGSGDLARSKAIESREKALVADCEKKTDGARCRVAAFDGGLQYVLVESFELTDIRLVYAPPRAVGEYGGEPDNFRWPRHTGDFSMARAYLNGQPYHPEFYFPIAKQGVKPGDFVMVLGYPGRTMRALTADEMANQRDFGFALRHQVLADRIRILEETTKGSRQGTIAVAATLKGLNNSNTNAMGQLAGLDRGNIIEKQRRHDQMVIEWAAGHSEYAGALEAKRELDRLAGEERRTARRNSLLGTGGFGSLTLGQAVTLVRLAHERTKPDLQREAQFMNRELPQLRAQMERAQKSLYRKSDEALMVDWITRALALGTGERIAAVDQAFGSRGDQLAATVTAMHSATKVSDLAERLRMFDETTDQLHDRRDPMLELAFSLLPEVQALEEAGKARSGAVARLRPQWRRAVIAQAGRPVAPDANGTLRVSFAHVKGYVPRDGVFYTPQTTLKGMIEKNTGEEPFAVPQMLLDAAKATDPAGVPLDFLSDADTTGGNSGSPTVNGRGELVGLNFDRVWENVANDFGYNPEIARNVNVDIRFFAWLVADIQKAGNLVEELGLGGR
jgi:hypothetical protein